MHPTSEQEALVACLARRSDKLARIYKGALSVLYDDANVGRFPLAAHAMRELIEKVPLLTGREQTPQGDSMKNRLGPVKTAYSTVKATGFIETSPLDSAEGLIRATLRELAKFLEWVEENRPEAKKRTAQLLSELSGPGQALPIDVTSNEVSRWLGADVYFKKVAHHGEDYINETEFLAHMTFIETVLLQRLQPMAVPDLDTLDELIREGENGN